VRDAAPRCGHCGYDVRGLPSPVCPECGSDLRIVGVGRRRPPPLSEAGWYVLAMLVLAILLFASVDNADEPEQLVILVSVAALTLFGLYLIWIGRR